MALVVGVCCVVSMCASAVYALPPPKDKTGRFEKFTEVADGRALVNLKVPPFVTSNVDACRQHCEYDFTCKGFNVWDDPDDPLKTKQKCLTVKEVPSGWNSAPAYLSGKQNSKIYVKVQ